MGSAQLMSNTSTKANSHNITAMANSTNHPLVDKSRLNQLMNHQLKELTC